MSKAPIVTASRRSLELVPNALQGTAMPSPLTPLVGRDVEIAEILALLDDQDVRLLTLTGPGGVGETRIAIEAAKRVEPDFAHGGVYVRLASIFDSGHVPAAVAQSVGVHDQDGQASTKRLAQELRDRHMLLILDNYEHLLDVPPLWLSELLGACPRITALVTSRIALNIDGEHRYVVPPLALPEMGAAPDDQLTSAVKLFVQRARARRFDFVIDDANREDVSEICRRLDGLPLAIELAAARVTVLTPAQMSARLTDRFQLLTGGKRDAPERQQSMRDAIAWSHDLLDPDDQRVFRHLSVFAGGFTLSAAEAVVISTSMDTVERVASLVDKSLLRSVDSVRGEPRYHMLETIREFGLERLVAAGDEDAVRDRHAGWCLALARQATPYDPTNQLEWLAGLEAEHGNLRAAMRWLDGAGRVSDLAEFVTRLRWFWYLGGRDAEGLSWSERVIEQLKEELGTMRIDALLFAGHLATALGKAIATTHLADARVRAKSAGDVLREAEAMFYTALWAENRGDYAVAETTFLAARARFIEVSNSWRAMVVAYHLGVLAYGRGELESAASILRAVMIEASAAGDQMIPAVARCFLALIACEQGEPDRAFELIRTQPANSNGSVRHDFAIMLGTAGAVASALGRHEAAARLFGAAAGTTEPALFPERAALERAAATSRRTLGEEV